jgi:hypothetical protein
MQQYNSIDWDSLNDSKSKELLAHFDSIKVRRVDIFSKPAVIIYNPNSGKKANLIPQIGSQLQSSGIPYEFMLT